jgi:hypothetical protein
LLPIGVGAVLVNIPLAEMMGKEGLFRFLYDFGIANELFPLLIFIGVGAMTDFGPLIANPKTLIVGAGAQLGVFVTYIGTLFFGFTLKEAASVGIIGGAGYAAGELNGFAERARHMIAIAEKALAPVVPEGKEGFTRYIRRDPVGIVLTIAPWNYPYLTAVNTVVPALMAGNAVMLKHAAQTILVGKRFQMAADRAGLPKGLFQWLVLGHEDATRLIASGVIDHVAFTGSVEAGRAIERAAAGTFASVGLELGGKDPAYVRADADLKQAVETVVDGAFFNSGQCCCGIERVYVHKDVYDAFVKEAAALTATNVLGNLQTTFSLRGFNQAGAEPADKACPRPVYPGRAIAATGCMMCDDHRIKSSKPRCAHENHTEHRSRGDRSHERTGRGGVRTCLPTRWCRGCRGRR